MNKHSLLKDHAEAEKPVNTPAKTTPQKKENLK